MFVDNCVGVNSHYDEREVLVGLRGSIFLVQGTHAQLGLAVFTLVNDPTKEVEVACGDEVESSIDIYDALPGSCWRSISLSMTSPTSYTPVEL